MNWDDKNLQADDDSIINDENQDDDNWSDSHEKEQKKTSNVAKILAQRNEARKKAEEADAKIAELSKEAKKVSSLEKKMADLEEMIAWNALEKEEVQKSTEFFKTNPKLKEFEMEIQETAKSKNLALTDAATFYLATNRPDLLVDEQYIAKKSPSQSMAWWWERHTPKNFMEMSDDEFMEFSNANKKWKR